MAESVVAKRTLIINGKPRVVNFRPKVRKGVPGRREPAGTR